MTEPDVTLTDFALALQGAAMAVYLARREEQSIATKTWMLYFAAAGLAALFGGLVHGYFLAPDSAGRAVFWPLSLVAIGVNTAAAAGIAGNLVLPAKIAGKLKLSAILLFAAYCMYVLLIDARFVVAIAIAAPATLFLLAALLVASLRDRRPGALVAACGVVLTMAAIAVQYFGIALDSARFNHNATAHVVQAAALALLFAGCLRLIDSSDAIETQGTPCSRDVIS